MSYPNGRRDSSIHCGHASNAPDSVSALVVTLVFGIVSFLFMSYMFALLRHRYPHVYMSSKQTGYLPIYDGLTKTWTEWWDLLLSLYTLRDDHVLYHHSLDSYLLLRFLRFCASTLFVGTCITWPILLPFNRSGGGEMVQLNSLTISNIAKESSLRYYAHCLSAWAFLGWFFVSLTREYNMFIRLFRKAIVDHLETGDTLCRTVLFTGVPVEGLRRSQVVDRIGREKLSMIWEVPDTKDVEKKIQEHDQTVKVIEECVVEYIRRRQQAYRKSTPTVTSKTSKHKTAAIVPNHSLTDHQSVLGTEMQATIMWAKSRMPRLKQEIEDLQCKGITNAPVLPCIFVEFNRYVDASSTFPPGLRRYDAVKDQIIWENLRFTGSQRTFHNIWVGIWIAIITLLYAVPVTMAAAFTSTDLWAELRPTLTILVRVPAWFRGAVAGLFPAALTSILMAVARTPIRCKLSSSWSSVLVGALTRSLGTIRQSGIPTLSSLELCIHKVFFGFLLIQILLVTGVSIAAPPLISQVIRRPEVADIVICSIINRTSNFYLSYILLQGLTLSASKLLQVGRLVVNGSLGKLFDNTPRKVYHRWSEPRLKWANIYSRSTLLVVLGIAYSCIAPLVVGAAALGLYLFFIIYRYNILYIMKATIDTRGKSFLLALQHVTIGCYLLIMYLISVFAIGLLNDRSAVGPMIVTVVLLVTVVIYHCYLSMMIRPFAGGIPRPAEKKGAPRFRTPASELWTPRIWFPHDFTGTIKTELEQLSGFMIAIDSAAWLDDHGKIVISFPEAAAIVNPCGRPLSARVIS
ncbi:hypothetical protein N7444_001525 [Penicillium canescens]|nr:hypothetical protein N7444_001525 [Penicillium canescens]